jgi:hypothetical protein
MSDNVNNALLRGNEGLGWFGGYLNIVDASFTCDAVHGERGKGGSPPGLKQENGRKVSLRSG